MSTPRPASLSVPFAEVLPTSENRSPPVSYVTYVIFCRICNIFTLQSRDMALVSQRYSSWLAALALSCSLLSPIFIPTSGFSQSQPDGASKRRVVVRTAPAYPSLARNMALTGVVRVDVLVTPEGTAKTVEVRGGHPVLAQAVVNAVRSWKWEPAAHESREPVEVKFNPE